MYWAGKAIAHIMVSFGFAGKDYLAVSIETRKEKGGLFDPGGFFGQYELYRRCRRARSVVRVRTTYRQLQEDVYIYRINGSLENLRRVFLDYIKSMNDLRERPSYYNTLTTNCTTSIWMHTDEPGGAAHVLKVLLSGYVPDYLYELGRLDKTRPFLELERISRVNERARAVGKDAAFSRLIREGLPRPNVMP